MPGGAAGAQHGTYAPYSAAHLQSISLIVVWRRAVWSRLPVPGRNRRRLAHQVPSTGIQGTRWGDRGRPLDVVLAPRSSKGLIKDTHSCREPPLGGNAACLPCPEQIHAREALTGRIGWAERMGARREDKARARRPAFLKRSAAAHWLVTARFVQSLCIAGWSHVRFCATTRTWVQGSELAGDASG